MANSMNGNGIVNRSIFNLFGGTEIEMKFKLAFFLASVAAVMVIIWMVCVFIFKATVDAGMAALLASFVTMFIKMAADAIGYQYSSSAGSDKKDETTAQVTASLAAQVAPAAVSAVGPPWWDKLSAEEKAAIEAAANAAPPDAVITKFMAAAKMGRATPDDLVYLVSKMLLTLERAKAIGG